MSKLIAIMSMSLDGFVADPDDCVSEVFDWYFSSGDVPVPIGGDDAMTFSMSEPSARHARQLFSELGAVLTGRRTFEKAGGWGWQPIAAWQPNGDGRRRRDAPALPRSTVLKQVAALGGLRNSPMLSSPDLGGLCQHALGPIPAGCGGRARRR